MRKLGEILLDLEVVLDEMIDSHDLQFGDVLNLVHGHMVIHRPDAQEEYNAGGNPTFYYGPKPDREKTKRQLKKLLKRLEDCQLGDNEADEIIDLIEKEYL